MKTATIRQTVGLGLLGAALIGTSACSDTVREGRSPAYLIIQQIDAASAAEEDDFSNELSSDVQTHGGVFEDLGRATFRLALRDIGPVGSPASPTSNNFITVNRYTVSYRRTDGRNQPGVDVPYAFEGAGTVTVGAADVAMSFVLVRAQAKLEAPLMNLRGGGQSVLIGTIADVTFYGKDQTGNDVSVTGSIAVNFADWADPDTGGEE
jgi:hypothetical protein